MLLKQFAFNFNSTFVETNYCSTEPKICSLQKQFEYNNECLENRCIEYCTRVDVKYGRLHKQKHEKSNFQDMGLHLLATLLAIRWIKI